MIKPVIIYLFRIKISNRIRMRNILLAILFFSFANVMIGQQESHYTHFMYNTLVLNPAYAGSRGTPSLVALYRKQWFGFEGSPDSKLMSFHAPIFGNKVGFGLTIMNDEIGIHNSWYGTMAYAYRIQINKETNVQIGLQGSIRYLGINFDDESVVFLHNNDPSINENMLSQNYLANFGAGIYVQVKQLFFGTSVPYLFPNTFGTALDPNILTAEETPHLYVMGGALLPVNKTLSLKPAVLAKIVKNAPFDLDLNLSFVFNNKIILGTSYRLGGDGPGESLDFLLHYRLNNLGLGIGYDFTLSDIKDYSNGSIEAIVIYDFKKERLDMANPRFFF